MAKNHHIRVIFDGDRLSIEPDQELEITEDTPQVSSVVWYFIGIEAKVENGWLPGIEFLKPQEQGLGLELPSSFGPFRELCTTDSRVIVSGNNGIRATYPYRATLRRLVDDKPLHSASARLKNTVSRQKPAAVQVDWDAAKDSFQIEPQEVTLSAGQPLRWEVNTVVAPKNKELWHPRLHFCDRNTNPCGPFGGLATTDQSLVAVGYRPQLHPCRYRFQMVKIVDGFELRESSPDPTIDDEGDPPTTSDNDLVPVI